mmetsp:Transcript_6709/g.10777  ORF Transcript_6709/g.10777 Transcript_6709/m.10777 type:complete len:162 (-) Transcript_6709:399-884(-)
MEDKEAAVDERIQVLAGSALLKKSLSLICETKLSPSGEEGLYSYSRSKAMDVLAKKVAVVYRGLKGEFKTQPPSGCSGIADVAIICTNPVLRTKAIGMVFDELPLLPKLRTWFLESADEDYSEKEIFSKNRFLIEVPAAHKMLKQRPFNQEWQSGGYKQQK